MELVRWQSAARDWLGVAPPAAAGPAYLCNVEGPPNQAADTLGSDVSLGGVHHLQLRPLLLLAEGCSSLLRSERPELARVKLPGVCGGSGGQARA